ncbi:hypothetical protein QCA50_009827 [Cerrena zonata]|uniref:Uncharacterized protein n=1 Tax=Cerrena zonata TaxID=2478898 RepID=A0AAW0G265_9APHY
MVSLCGRRNLSTANLQLFNILDPRESQKDVPDNFSPLTTSSLSSKPIRYPNQLQAQIYTSQEITQKDLPADKSSRNEHPDTVTCQYRCEGESGALLALQEGCDSVLVPHNRDWISYMRRNHRSWYDYVTQKRGLTIDKEDIILVRGHVKARNWAIASFRNQGEVLQLSLQGRVPYGKLGAVSGENRVPGTRKSSTFQEHPLKDLLLDVPPSPVSSTADSMSSQPPQPADPSDCIFLSAYKARYRVLRKIPLILATADPNDLPGDDPSEYGCSIPEDDAEETEVEVIIDPEYSKPRLHVDRIHGYSLSSTDADVAILPDTFTKLNCNPAIGLLMN